IFTVGAGYLDVWAALNDVNRATGSALSPTALYSTGSISMVATTALNGVFTVWGSSAVWGSTAVWGSSVLIDPSAGPSGSSAVWGSTAVWGSAFIGGSSAVWGSTAVWGASSPMAENLSQLINGEK